MNVAIIDYGLGNLASVQKALTFLQVPSKITNDKKEITDSDFLLLPGVGSFAQGMQNLNERGLVSLIKEEVEQKKKPLLGICLGMQLLAEYGYEIKKTKGLGLIEGEVLRIIEEQKRVPHLGWNSVNFSNSEFNEYSQKDFYFIHSYHFKTKTESAVIGTVNYGKSYTAAVQRENIIATQFHPEKSQKAGLNLLKSIFDYYAED